MNLAIAQILLEKAEFEHREDYMTLPPTTPNQSAVTLTATAARNAQNPLGDVLVKLHASNASPTDLYRFDVVYVVFYRMTWDEGEPVPDDLDRRLLVTGSNMLFPFARETVATLTAKGRFGTTWLAPTNFNALDVSPSEPVSAGG